MAKFFKATNRENPKHHLPAVLWNERAGKPHFEFARGPSGLHEFETDDDDVIKILRDRGYDEEPRKDLSGKPLPLKAHEVYPEAAAIPEPEAQPAAAPAAAPAAPPPKRRR